MTSSQIFTSGLASGGLVLLAILLIYFIMVLRQLRRPPATAGPVRNPKTWLMDGSSPLPAFFSTLSELPAHERADWDPHQDGRLPSISNWRWAVLLFIALALSVYAEFSLLELLEANWNANILVPIGEFLIAGAIFVFVCRRVEGPSFTTRFQAVAPVRLAPTPTLWLTNLCLSLLILGSIDRDLPPGAGYVVLGLWIVNILLFCWNIFQIAYVPLPGRDEIGEWWHTHRLEVLLVSLIGLVALLIRIIGLETYPYAFTGSEGEVGGETLRILSGANTSFFLTNGLSSIPAVAFLPGAIAVKLLGNIATAIRLFSAVQGTLAVVFLYLVAREAFGRAVALIAGCLLAVLPWHVHFSRVGLFNIADSFFSAGVFWLTYRALRHGRYLDYLLAGLMTGFAIYTYLGSRLVIVLAIAVLVYTCLRQRDYLKAHLRHLAIFVLAFLVVASPMIVSFLYHSDDFMSRLNSEGLLADHQLEEFASSVAMQPSDYMITQVQNATMVFIARPGTAAFFDTPRPYLAWWAAVLLILGMAYTLWHIKEVRYMLLAGWFWAPVLIGGALTTFPPTNQRMLAAAPALALIVALGLWKLALSIRAMTRLPANWFMAVCILAVAFIAWQDADYYFAGQYRLEHHYESASNEFSYEVGTRAGALGPAYRLLVLGGPDISAGSAAFHYLAPYADAQDLNEITVAQLNSLPRDRGIFFAAIPERVDDLRLITQQLPGGDWLEVPHRTHAGIAYYGYILPPISGAP